MSGLPLSKNITLFPSYYEGATTMSDVFEKKQDIINSIDRYDTSVADFNDKRKDDDILDDDGNFKVKNKISDAVQEDIQTILIQENTLYTVGIVTTATLILAAILISK
jgi:hypothetical protein